MPDRDFPSQHVVDDERQPLLQNQEHQQNGTSGHNGTTQQNGSSSNKKEVTVDFEDDDDPTNPRHWPKWKKYTQVLLIFLIAFILPSSSSIFAPAISEIASTFHSSTKFVLLGQGLFVIMLGIGPLFLAPMSETFGRRVLFLGNLAVFSLLQVPTALVGGVEGFVVLRCLGGFFGSVGVANGGGSISDMFETHERAVVLGVYLVGPLLGPSVGPLIGGLIVSQTSWRWIFGLVGILAGTMTVLCYFFLYETRAQTILEQRKARLEKENPGTTYKVAGAPDDSPSLLSKIGSNSTRAVKILTTQPIVLTMSLYQALIFSTMYTLYSQYTTIWTSPPYSFTKTQLGLTYLGPALGFILTAIFIVAFIDRVYTSLARKYSNGEGEPEYRLPMANIGAVFLPISLFWFGWSVETKQPWPVPVIATLFFGGSQVSIFNCVQTYYIDAFESQAASALAAGAFLRSVIGGIVPLFVSGMFERLGYGWGMSVFGAISLVLMPAPLLFFWFGKKLREKFPFKG